MSVAFTREEDLEAAAAHVPDRPISPNPNLVTPQGLAHLDAALSAARAAYAAAQAAGQVGADRTAMAVAARELRYFTTRRASAQVTVPHGPPGVAVFGSRVTFDRQDGRRQSFRIVGEDEADAKKGSVSYVSPVARALLGKRVGELGDDRGRRAPHHRGGMRTGPERIAREGGRMSLHPRGPPVLGARCDPGSPVRRSAGLLTQRPDQASKGPDVFLPAAGAWGRPG